MMKQLQKLVESWKEQGYKVTGESKKSEDEFYHYKLQSQKDTKHAIVKFIKRGFVGIGKPNVDFLSQVAENNRYTILINEQEDQYAILPHEIEQKAKFCETKNAKYESWKWDKSGKGKRAYHVVWSKTKLILKSAFEHAVNGRLDISNFVGNCKALFKEIKKKVKLSAYWLPRPSSKYHGSYPRGFENLIVERLGTKNIIHFFCGSSKLGYGIDINKDVNPDLVANVEELKQIPDNSFEAGLADPPYTEKFARDLYNCEYPKWNKWVNELVRTVKVGGLIAIMHNYPQPKPKNANYVEVMSILCRIKQFTKVVTIFRKVRN